MSERKIYHVLPDDTSGRRRVLLRKAKKASATADTKDEAVGRAIELAKNNMPSQVIVRKMDGTVQKEYTYGKDPVRYKG